VVRQILARKADSPPIGRHIVATEIEANESLASFKQLQTINRCNGKSA